MGAALPVSLPPVSGDGVSIAAGKRLAMPAGGMPPAANFLAMPGGRLRLRFASPGGIAFDLPGDDCCAGIAGAVLEMCILTPRLPDQNMREGLMTPQPNWALLCGGKAASQIHAV